MDAISLLKLPADFELSILKTWPLWFSCAYCGVIALGLEILSHIVHLLFGFAAKIPVRGKHLDEFSSTGKIMFLGKDRLYEELRPTHISYHECDSVSSVYILSCSLNISLFDVLPSCFEVD